MREILMLCGVLLSRQSQLTYEQKAKVMKFAFETIKRAQTVRSQTGIDWWDM